MTRNEAIELLEKYNELLMKEGYADSDLWCEHPTAIDQFLGTKWAKENLPLSAIENTETYPTGFLAWILELVNDEFDRFETISEALDHWKNDDFLQNEYQLPR